MILGKLSAPHSDYAASVEFSIPILSVLIGSNERFVSELLRGLDDS